MWKKYMEKITEGWMLYEIKKKKRIIIEENYK